MTDKKSSASGFSLNIGTKLGLMSALGVALVIAMLAGSIYGNSTVRHANNVAAQQQELAFDFAQLKASARGMMVGVRDLRLAASPADTAAATKYFEERRQSTLKYIEEALPHAAPENRVRLEKMKALVAQYAIAAKDIGALHNESHSLSEKRSEANASEVDARVKSIEGQIVRIAKERALPTAGELQSA